MGKLSAVDARSSTIGDCRRHQHLRRSRQARDARGQIDRQTFHARMSSIATGAGTFTHLAHVDAKPQAGQIGL